MATGILGAVSPMLAPDLVEKQLKMQQQAAMLQRVMANASQPNEGRMVSGHWVPPDMGRSVANAFGLYGAMKGMEEQPKQMADLLRAQQQYQADLLQKAYGGQGQPGQPGQPGSGQGSGQGGFAPGLSGSPMSPQEILRASLMGVDKYALERFKQGAPTPEQKNLGFLPPEARDSIIAGGLMQKAVGPDGAQLRIGPSGMMSATPIPGFRDNLVANAGAVAGEQAAAKTPYTLTTVPMGNQGTQLMSEADALAKTGSGAAGVPGSSPSGQFGHTPNPARQAAVGKLNDDWITHSYRPTLNAAQAATALKGEIRALRGIEFPTGALGNARGVAANFMSTLGIKDAEKYATSSQSMNAVIMQKIQRDMALQKGVQTEGDADRAMKTWASVSNTPQANKFILDLAEATSNKAIRKAEYFAQARKIALENPGAGLDLSEIEERWNRNQPSLWDDPILSPYGGNVK